MSVDYVEIGFDMEVQPLAIMQLGLYVERYLHRCREQSFAIRAYDMSVVVIDVVSVHNLFAYRFISTVRIDVVSSHMKYCRSHMVSQDSRSISKYK